MKKKQILTISITVILVMLISVAGTLAYLTATTPQITNTFAAVGLIEPGPDSFKLFEHEAEYDTTINNYKLNTTEVMANTYTKVAPGMNIPKDPQVNVDVATGSSAYIFIKVIDELNENLKYTIDSANWELVDAAKKVYVYKNGVVDGVDGFELQGIGILANNQVTVDPGITSFGDLTDGALGTLKFNAYACQAQTFATAAEAWAACFPNE